MNQYSLDGKSTLQRFEEKFKIAPSCWEWTGAKIRRGYGVMRISRKTVYAHRIAYEINIGEIPLGMMVCHTCDNPSCVNPGHLFLGTALDNALDKVRKGRSLKGEKDPSSKLTDCQVLKIRSDAKENRELALEYSVSRSLISMIKTKKLWHHI